MTITDTTLAPYWFGWTCVFIITPVYPLSLFTSSSPSLFSLDLTSFQLFSVLWVLTVTHWVGPRPLGSTYFPVQLDTRPFLVTLNPLLPLNYIVLPWEPPDCSLCPTHHLLYMHLLWVAKNSLSKSENQANWVILPNFIIAFNASRQIHFSFADT